MDRYNEYQEYMKKITDGFISRLTHHKDEYITPKYKIEGDQIIFTGYSVDDNYQFHFEEIDGAPTSYDEVRSNYSRTPKKVIESWMKIENEYAIKWLSKNTITYDDWSKKQN